MVMATNLLPIGTGIRGQSGQLSPEIFVMEQMYGSATPVVQEAAVEMSEQHQWSWGKDLQGSGETEPMAHWLWTILIT